uniref:Putative GCN5-related N-acetyltransferase n=1 Tax=mine drainage metagenome TaxID=410659 RepID=E6PZL1_9ZZZZ
MNRPDPDTHPPPSNRLSFRTWAESDHDLAISLWTNPEVMQFLGGTGTPQAAIERLRLEMQRQQQFGVQYWPIFRRSDGAFAGCAGLRPFHNEHAVFELGVHIARPFWSGRIGEEAARAVIAFAFNHLHARALTAGHNPDNTHSKALILRLGFQFTHLEPWGPLEIHHPFYRLEPSASSEPATDISTP